MKKTQKKKIKRRRKSKRKNAGRRKRRVITRKRKRTRRYKRRRYKRHVRCKNCGLLKRHIQRGGMMDLAKAGLGALGGGDGKDGGGDLLKKGMSLLGGDKGGDKGGGDLLKKGMSLLGGDKGGDKGGGDLLKKGMSLLGGDKGGGGGDLLKKGMGLFKSLGGKMNFGSGGGGGGGGGGVVPSLPLKFGDALGKGTAFPGAPPLPSIMQSPDMKGNMEKRLPSTFIPDKLVPPKWSDETVTNIKNMDQLIEVDMQELFERAVDKKE
jgi:hypothetical protein